MSECSFIDQIIIHWVYERCIARCTYGDERVGIGHHGDEKVEEDHNVDDGERTEHHHAPEASITLDAAHLEDGQVHETETGPEQRLRRLEQTCRTQHQIVNINERIWNGYQKKRIEY